MNLPLWPPFYDKVARALVSFADKRDELFDRARGAAAQEPLMGYLKLTNAEFWEKRNYAIDPFTLMGVFNRPVTPAHRAALAKKIALLLDIPSPEPPAAFRGAPTVDPRHAIFEGPETLWELALAARGEDPLSEEFGRLWDRAREFKGNGASMLSIGLFWLNSEVFMPMDKMADPYLAERYGISAPHGKCDGREYAAFAREVLEKASGTPLPAITLAACERAKE